MNLADKKYKICEFCLADNELRDEVRTRGSLIESCPICHSSGGRSLPAADPTVRRIFRALVRLNYSEWDYNGHLGGESLEQLVAESNKIFNLPSGASMLDFEDAFLILEEDWYPDQSEDISLGGGYWDGVILPGLRERMDHNVIEVLHRVLTDNSPELQAIVAKLIASINDDIAKEMPAGSQFFRARLGVKSRFKAKRHWDFFTDKERHYLPFSGADIDRPPAAGATEGRFNRPGVSILYLATDKDTAVAELKPHPGHLVSTAQFVSVQPIRVADFSNHDIRNFLSDDRLEDLRKILSFGAVLNLPVQREYQTLYILTQLFSDAIRNAGFHGLSFRSTVGRGCNLACLTENTFQQVSGSESVLEVRALNYELRQRNSLPQNYDREAFESDGDDILSTLFDGLARNA